MLQVSRQRSRERNVDVASQQRVDLPHGRHLGERHVDVLVTLPEGPYYCRKEAAVSSNEKSDGQVSDLASHGLLDGLHGPLRGLQRRLCTRQKDLPMRCQLDLPLGAIDQHRAYFSLEIAHLFADRRLRNMQCSRGFAEAAARCDCHEVMKMPQFHRCSVA